MKRFKQFISVLMILSVLAVPASCMARDDSWIDELRDGYNKYYQGLLLAAQYRKDELPKRFTDLAEGDPDRLAVLVRCAEIFKHNLAASLDNVELPFDHPGCYIDNYSYYSWKYNALRNVYIKGFELVYEPRMDRFSNSSFIQAVDTALYWGRYETRSEYETSNHTVISESDDGVMFSAPAIVPLVQPIYLLPLLLSICSLENDFSFLEDIEYFDEFPGTREEDGLEGIEGLEFYYIEFSDCFFAYMNDTEADPEDAFSHTLTIDHLSQQ